jgi:hypothetical protein
VLKHGVKVAAVAVKAPRDPNATTDPDDPEETEADVDAPEGAGLDQGALARVKDTLTPAARTPTPLPAAKGQPPAPVAASMSGPLLGPPPSNAPVRTYITVGVATNGRHGPSSKRVVVPLVSPPAAPSAPEITFDETAITVTWRPSATAAVLQEPASDDLLPTRPFGITPSRVAYHVYEKPQTGEETLLTRSPVTQPQYSDSRLTWGATRCYVVRTVQIVDALSVESEASAPTCTKLVDTFPPAAPMGLNAVAAAGEINLIWDPNPEADLDGYIVLRGPTAAMLMRITPMPIHDTTFHDTVPAGTRYVYAVQAVDKAGNTSSMSAPIEETAR